MATEKDANNARAKYTNYLTGKGAHSISIDEVNYGGKRTFAVIVYTSNKSRNFPKTLDIEKDGETVQVPVIVKIQGLFLAE